MHASSVFWPVLIMGVTVATVLYVVYRVRRTLEERRQRSAERETALLAALGTMAVRRDAGAQAGATAGAQPVPKPAAARPAHTATLLRRPTILTDAQRSLFLLLRAALPDHLIMPHVRIFDLLDQRSASGSPQRDEPPRSLLLERLDFVVCSSDLVPVAAIVLYDAGLAHVPDETLKIDALRELGIRFLRFRADELPRPADMCGLILG